MTDYLCDACGHRSEAFYHRDPPSELNCAECEGGTAKKIYSLPGEYRPRNSQGFSPIVIWVNNDNPDQVSFPPRSDEPVQEGYHAVHITNMSQADRWTKKLDKVALDEAYANRECQKHYWDQVTKERRDSITAKIGSNPRARALFKAVQEYVDRKREKKYSGTMDPRSHFQALSYDASNRQGYSDADSGWRNRK
jgi:hypothetical protein